MLPKACNNSIQDNYTTDGHQRNYREIASKFFVTMPLARKVPDVTKEQIYVDAISR